MVDGYLMHHGIKGQKWGVRRFQNEDGTYTAEGRQRRIYRNNIIRNRPYTKDVNNIVDTMSRKDKMLLGTSTKKNEKWIDPKYELETLTNKAKTVVIKEGKTPVSFVEIWTNGSNTGEIAIGTNKNYRGKGYASKAAKKAIKWADTYGKTSIKELKWIPKETNTASINLAKKLGFEESKEQNLDGYLELIRKNPNYKGG